MESKTMETSGSGSLFSTNIFGNVPSPAPVEKPESVLTPSEQEIYDSLSDQEKSHLTGVVQGMNLALPNFTSEYGKEARVGISQINKQALSVTRTKDLGKVGKSMSNLLLQLKGIDIPSQASGIFGRVRSYTAQLNAQLTTAEANIEKSVKIMQTHQRQLAEDNEDFDALYKNNLGHYKALCLYIIAGKLKLDEERRTTLANLRQKATKSGDMADAEAYRDYESKLKRFDSLLSEFESSKTLCLQTAPAIRMAQENNQLLIDKFDYIFTIAVPAWYTQIHLALNLENTKEAGEVIGSAIDFTNDIIKKNAELLNQGTVTTARLAEREIIESSTLEYANQQLIQGLEEVFKIHAEGEKNRAASREKRTMLEDDLRNELLKLTAASQ